MKRSRILVIGAAVLAALVVVLIVAKSVPKKAPKAPPAITLSKVDQSKITKIVLNHGGQRVVLDRSGKDFVADYPIQVSWDTTNIRQVVSTFVSLDADRVVEKNPTDLGQFGLQPAAGTGEAVLTDGSSVKLSVGNKTPSGTDYYVMKAGDPALYTVSTYNAGPLLSSYDSLRDKSLPSINTKKIALYSVTTAGTTAEIVPMAKDDPMENVAFAGFKVVKPYKVPRAASLETLNKILKTFPAYLQIQKFISDRPTDMAQYGLQPPKAHVILKDDKNTLNIELGNMLPDGTTMYAKIPGKPTVFTVNYSDFKSLLTTSVFDLTDKFLLIPNIANVDSFTVKTTEGETYTAVLKHVPAAKTNGSTSATASADTTTTYTVNGKTIEEAKFKSFYQDVIGLLADSANPKPNIAFKPEITITFHLNKGDKRTYSEYFVPYNRDFYAVFRNGVADMLLDRGQVTKMLTDGKALVSGQSASSS